jgi:hypothetical protein
VTPINGEEVYKLPRPPKMQPGYFIIESVGPLPGSTNGGMLARIEAAIKVNSPERPYAVANEYIAARLAYATGLPVPPGELVKLPNGKPGFICLMFKPEGSSLAPVIPAQLVEQDPKFCTGVILFDMWVRNSIDRHEENLGYDEVAGGVIYDHDLALLGSRPGKATAELINAKDQPCLDGHCLVPELRTMAYLHEWADRIKAVPLPVLEDTAQKVFRLGLINASERDEVVQFLVFRQRRLLAYVGQCRNMFDSVADWPLLDAYEAGEN